MTEGGRGEAKIDKEEEEEDADEVSPVSSLPLWNRGYLG